MSYDLWRFFFYKQIFAKIRFFLQNNNVQLKKFQLRPTLSAKILKIEKMKLYHGSKEKFEVLERNQAQSPNVKVPNDELLNAIYLTPDYDFAIAMCAPPEGHNEIDDDNKKIILENPEKFDTESDIYIYSIESDKIPQENLKRVDKLQYAVVDTPEIKPDLVEHLKAGEILKYYELTNWKPKEPTGELRENIRIK